MRKNVRPDMIEWISRYWDDRRKGGEVQEVVEAIVAELKKDYRAWQRSHRDPEGQAHWESLIADVQDNMFWVKINHLLHFSFDY